MRYIILFLYFFALNGVEWNGVVYDDDSVAEMITVITTTSPIPSIPSTKFLYEAQKSLFRIPALAKCKKIIVFDAPRNLTFFYPQYKKNVQFLVNHDPYFSNTKLIFCPKWVHLCGTIKEAIQHVDTPFVFIHQHDLLLIRDFDLNGIVATIAANPSVKYVAVTNANNNDWYAPVEEGVEGVSFVPLCKVSGWSDQCHVTTVDYYTNFVLPQCDHTFMENVLQPALKKAVKERGFSDGWPPYGACVYGDLDDPAYIFHANGRKNLQFPLVK